MKFTSFLGICLVFFLSSCHQSRQPDSFTFDGSIKNLDEGSLSGSVSFRGKLLEAKEWSDNNGENLLVISRYLPPAQIYPDNPDLTTESAFLYIRHFIKEGPEFHLDWEKADSVTACTTDYWIGTPAKSTSITDLDKDGVSEITVIYFNACRGDVSPSDMKLILTEGGNSYTLQGETYIDPDGKKLNRESFEPDLRRAYSDTIAAKPASLMGRYRNSEEFNSAPSEFLEFARKQWMEYFDKDHFEQL